MEKLCRAVGYVRTAHPESDGYNAIENQIAKIKEFVSKRKDLQLSEIFSDQGVSGLTFDRLGFNELLNEVRSGNVDCVIVCDISRIGLKMIEVHQFISYVFTDYNIEFIAIDDNYSPDTLPLPNNLRPKKQL